MGYQVAAKPPEVETHVHLMRSSKLLKSIPETVPTLSTCGGRILFPVVRMPRYITKKEDDCEDDIRVHIISLHKLRSKKLKKTNPH